MIFVTIGTQLAFPRLITAMETLAPSLDEEIVAQVGPDSTPRKGLIIHPTLGPAKFAELFAAARVVVAHTGIGTILSAKANRKPLIVVPRRFALGEHRNDHQMATAQQVAELPGIHVAWETDMLGPLLTRKDLPAATPEPGPDAARLIAHLRAFIDD